jgi:hypothetical protein
MRANPTSGRSGQSGSGVAAAAGSDRVGSGRRLIGRRSAPGPDGLPGDRPVRPQGPGRSDESCLREGTASLRPGHAGPDSDRTWVRRSSRSRTPIDPPAPARAVIRRPTVGRYRVGGRTDSTPLRLPDEPDGAAQPPARKGFTGAQTGPDLRSGRRHRCESPTGPAFITDSTPVPGPGSLSTHHTVEAAPSKGKCECNLARMAPESPRFRLASL